MARLIVAAAAAVLILSSAAASADSLLQTPVQLVQARANATPIPEASSFITSLADRAIAGLADKDIGVDERASRFRNLLTAGFDIPTIARFVLGRYWRVATPDERDEYTKLFEDYIVQSYSQRFTQYGGETLQVGGAAAQDDNEVMVGSNLVRPSGPPVKVDWKLRHEGQSFKIIDVVVEGVSMSVTQRDDFSATIASHGGKVAGLIDVLRQKVRTASN
jgi:phospholipid transport system substrate-binding protein